MLNRVLCPKCTKKFVKILMKYEEDISKANYENYYLKLENEKLKTLISTWLYKYKEIGKEISDKVLKSLTLLKKNKVEKKTIDKSDKKD